jgi:hypothetical protein
LMIYRGRIEEYIYIIYKSSVNVISIIVKMNKVYCSNAS